MNTSFEKSKNSTDEWYTPKEIIDALGEFDLDPCAPMRPLWRTARASRGTWTSPLVVRTTVTSTTVAGFGR